jgi:hypothetical protein
MAPAWTSAVTTASSSTSPTRRRRPKGSPARSRTRSLTSIRPALPRRPPAAEEKALHEHSQHVVRRGRRTRLDRATGRRASARRPAKGRLDSGASTHAAPDSLKCEASRGLAAASLACHEPADPGSGCGPASSLPGHPERSDPAEKANHAEDPKDDAADDHEDDARDDEPKADDVGCHVPSVRDRVCRSSFRIRGSRAGVRGIGTGCFHRSS